MFIIIYTITNTWAYFQQADLTGHQLHDRAARTSFLANIDIAVNTITVLIQIFLTGRLMKWFGVGITLVLMPLLSVSRLCRDWCRAGSHRACDVPDFATGCRLCLYFDPRAKFSSPSCAGRINTKLRV